MSRGPSSWEERRLRRKRVQSDSMRNAKERIPSSAFDSHSAPMPNEVIMGKKVKPAPWGGPWFTLLLLVVSVVGILGALYNGAPILFRSDWVVQPLAFWGVPSLAILGWSLERWRLGVGPKWGIVVAPIVIVIVAAFVYGGSNFTLIGGKAYLITSKTAKAYQYATDVRKDQQTLAKYADLLDTNSPSGTTLSQTDIDTKYTPAERALTSMQTKYTKYNSEADYEAFKNVTNDMLGSISLETEALQKRTDLGQQYDVSVLATLQGLESDLATTVVGVPDELRGVTESQYHFNIYDGRPVE